MSARLTNAQFAFLELCWMYTGKRDCVGAIAKGSTRRCAERLESLGLVRFEAFGVERDRGGEWREDWPIYAITDAGRAYLKWAQPGIEGEGSVIGGTDLAFGGGR